MRFAFGLLPSGEAAGARKGKADKRAAGTAVFHA